MLFRSQGLQRIRSVPLNRSQRFLSSYLVQPASRFSKMQSPHLGLQSAYVSSSSCFLLRHDGGTRVVVVVSCVVVLVNSGGNVGCMSVFRVVVISY